MQNAKEERQDKPREISGGMCLLSSTNCLTYRDYETKITHISKTKQNQNTLDQEQKKKTLLFISNSVISYVT